MAGRGQSRRHSGRSDRDDPGDTPAFARRGYRRHAGGERGVPGGDQRHRGHGRLAGSSGEHALRVAPGY